MEIELNALKSFVPEQFFLITKSIQEVKDHNHEVSNSTFASLLKEHVEFPKEENKVKSSIIQFLTNQYYNIFNDTTTYNSNNNNNNDNISTATTTNNNLHKSNNNLPNTSNSNNINNSSNDNNNNFSSIKSISNNSNKNNIVTETLNNANNITTTNNNNNSNNDNNNDNNNNNDIFSKRNILHLKLMILIISIQIKLTDANVTIRRKKHN